MKRCVALMAALSMLLAACAARPSPTPITISPAASSGPQAPSPSPSPPPSPSSTAAPVAMATPVPLSGDAGGLDGMAALLPGKTGYEWRYSGFAEYAQTMKLKSVDRAEGKATYTAEGAVADMSGGAAGGDFSVKVLYTVTPGSMAQSLTGGRAMDSTLPSLELIRAPLEKGTQWVQAVNDRYGKPVKLDCTITDVKQANGRRTYFVLYQVESGDYYEKREITEGSGVTAYDKLYMYDSGREEIGYRLSPPEVQAYTAGWDEWLPPLDCDLTYFGLAEYGHKGRFVRVSASGAEAVYEFRGMYDDATGNYARFVTRYVVDLARGTVTEQAVSNERGKKEVNSKLHNLVILKFPLAEGASWSHRAKLNGRDVTVRAEITEYDEANGVVKVRYTAGGAAGYYDDTYIETRTFEKGYGMTGFASLLPGSIGIEACDAKDAGKLGEAVTQHMFGYSLNKTLLQ